MSEARLSLAGRFAIVTGGGRGMGRAMALSLAVPGTQVVVTSARSLVDVEAVAVENSSGTILPVLADVTRHEDPVATVAAALAGFGRVDLLMNNAGRGMGLVSDDFLTRATRF